MSEKCICDIMVNRNNLGEKLSICLQLSVVDETKTDMEYKCFKSED